MEVAAATLELPELRMESPLEILELRRAGLLQTSLKELLDALGVRARRLGLEATLRQEVDRHEVPNAELLEDRVGLLEMSFGAFGVA